MCKCGDTLSLAVLIDRGLDQWYAGMKGLLGMLPLRPFPILAQSFRVPLFLPFVQFSGYRFALPLLMGGLTRAARFATIAMLPCDGYAPLAQLVEHLTLNQGVPGSSP